MRLGSAGAAGVAIAVWVVSSGLATAGQGLPAGAGPDRAAPLPAYLTPAERARPLPPTERDGRSPPTGTVVCPAEYEPQDGVLIAWEGYTSILTELTVAITTYDPLATVWVVVDSSSEQSSAASALASAGADMSQVAFIVRTTDSVWIRDYGPRFIFEDGVRTVIDHTYNRPRPNDNLLNDYLCTLWGLPQYQLPLTHGGGNFHLFANGDAFMSDLILAENPGLSAQDVQDLYRDYQNVNLTIYPGFPSSFDSTRHIDMWLFPAGDYRVIIGQYASATGLPHTITENAAADLAARGYTVFRTPGWNAGGTHYTYTNAVVLNDQVFISKFGGSYTAQDAQALAVFQAAMPGYTIRQINCASIISAAGALHCIVMHVPAYAPDPVPVARLLAPNGGEVAVVGQPLEIAWTASDDVGVTGIDLYLSTDGGASFPELLAAGEANDGHYTWTVPDRPGTRCRIRVVAHDADGQSGSDDSDGDFAISATGPQLIYGFPLDDDPGWACTGLWAWGRPSGGGGQHGFPDPTAGVTGANVYGYNLAGDYENNLAPRTLTSGPLDCSDLVGVRLVFWRWLGVESSTFDRAALHVSPDGANWTLIWQNAGEVADAAWTRQEYDLAAVADGQPAVYLRWTMGPTDSSYQYCGWNLDDIELWATRVVTGRAGDLDCDGQVTFADIDPFVLALMGEAGYTALYPDCRWLNADCDADGNVTFADIDPFVALLSGR